jgi:hypothetical protein
VLLRVQHGAHLLCWTPSLAQLCRQLTLWVQLSLTGSSSSTLEQLQQDKHPTAHRISSSRNSTGQPHWVLICWSKW